MASAIFRPLNSRDGMQTRWTDGSPTSAVAAQFIKPNDRLSSFERLEIYNRVYWFRVLDCLYDDYPGLRAIVGERKFLKLTTAYLAKYPSASFTLRNLGQRLEKFLREEPQWIVPNEELALDMARFEWAQVVAFDDAAQPKITTDDVLDTAPSKLRLGLQPYLSLLELNYAVDKFLLAVKKREGAVLRDEASNTFEAMPQTIRRKRPVRRPKRERVSPRRPSLRQHALLQAARSGGLCHFAGIAERQDRGKSLRCRTRENDPNRHRLDPANSGMVSRLVCARLVLPVEKMRTLMEKFYRWLIALGSALRSPLLLAVRLFWGWQFFLTGKGKLMDLAKTTQFFESLGIPFPHAQAVLAGSVECFGGLLLLIGLATRLISVPLMILLTVAYLTADIDRVRAIFGDPDKFVTADEFLFLFTVVIIFVFGPGAFSLDALIGKYFERHAEKGSRRIRS